MAAWSIVFVYFAVIVCVAPIYGRAGNAQNVSAEPSPNQGGDGYTVRKLAERGLVEWDSRREPWLNFHIRMCGQVCHGTQYLRVKSSRTPKCKSDCFPCDCSITCPIYGTCCPQFDPSTPLKGKDIEITSYGIDFIGRLSEYKFIDGTDYSEKLMTDSNLRCALILRGRFRCSQTEWPTTIFGRVAYSMVATCPPSESNQTLRHLCESDDDDTALMNSEFLKPLTDSRSNVTFKNVYCAKCSFMHEDTTTTTTTSSSSSSKNSNNKNNQMNDKCRTNSSEEDFSVDNIGRGWGKYRHTHLSPWEIKIECPSYQKFHRINSEDDFLQAVLNDAMDGAYPVFSRCAVKLTPPSGLGPSYKCPRHIPKLEQGGSCSQMDSPVSKTLHDLCHRLNDTSYRYWSRYNVFCYLCQDQFPACHTTRIFDIPRQPQVLKPLAFLLGSHTRAHLSYSLDDDDDTGSLVGVPGRFRCNETLYWMNDKDVCQLPECIAGKSLNMNSESCETVVKRINGLRYKVSMVIFPKHTISPGDLTSIHRKVVEFFSTVEAANLAMSYVVYGLNSSDEKEFLKYVKVTGNVQANSKLYRDTFEESLLETTSALNENEAWFPMFNNSDIIFGEETATIFLHEGLKSNTREASENSSIHHKYLRSFELQEHKKLEVFQSSWMQSFNIEDDYIDLNPSLLCPFVELNISSIYNTTNQGVSIGFFYKGEEELLSLFRYADKFSITDGNIRICIDVFRNEFQRITNVSRLGKNKGIKISAMDIAILYLTLICLGISVFSLILSIVTYILFPVLRNLPGLNTLTLCVCLSFAQLCLIAVTLLVGRIEGWPCQILGILLHYGWLAAFHWMSACCIHMYMVFNKTQARRTLPYVWKPFLKYSAYTFGMPAFYIGLHVTISEIISRGASFGYSPQLCLFDTVSSKLPPIFSFLLPLSIVVLSNGVLFFLTIRKIVSVRSLQERVGSKKKKGGEEVVTYVKLSTLTGLFWLLTILAVQLDNDVLTLISTPLVALQGLFIFFSFTVNGRVQSLYLALITRSKSTDNSTTLPTVSTTGGSDVTKTDRPEVM